MVRMMPMLGIPLMELLVGNFLQELVVQLRNIVDEMLTIFL